jgi:hypothetical protein
MKTCIYSAFILFLLIFSSCSRIPEEEKMVGNWKLYHAGFDSINLDPAFKTKAKKSLESSNFSFQHDKQFQIADMSFSGGSYKGIWSYKPEKKQLTLFYPDLNIDPEVYDVIKLTRRQMILHLKYQSLGFFEYRLKRIRE